MEAQEDSLGMPGLEDPERAVAAQARLERLQRARELHRARYVPAPAGQIGSQPTPSAPPSVTAAGPRADRYYYSRAHEKRTFATCSGYKTIKRIQASTPTKIHTKVPKVPYQVRMYST